MRGDDCKGTHVRPARVERRGTLLLGDCAECGRRLSLVVTVRAEGSRRWGLASSVRQRVAVAGEDAHAVVRRHGKAAA